MSKKLDYEYLEEHGFRQLGNRPIWSNTAFQLHQYPEGFGVFKRSDNNVLYNDTGKTLFTRAGFKRWRESLLNSDKNVQECDATGLNQG